MKEFILINNFSFVVESLPSEITKQSFQSRVKWIQNQLKKESNLSNKAIDDVVNLSKYWHNYMHFGVSYSKDIMDRLCIGVGNDKIGKHQFWINQDESDKVNGGEYDEDSWNSFQEDSQPDSWG